ncbi:MAG TPA: metal-sensitive transcriptional regulator [Bacillota bacterium]|nr:metal-sensitive transcriptional regulator [Bacillota bacterium]
MAEASASSHESHYHRDNADLLARLRRVEGQVRGIQRMVEEDRYCVEILMQLAAVRAAVNQVGRQLLESHTRGCVAGALRSGDGEQAVAELVEVVNQFLR